MVAALGEAQISSYWQQGCLALRGVFSADEVAAWDAESRRLLKLGLGHKDNWRTVVYQTPLGLSVILSLNLSVSPDVDRIAYNPRLLAHEGGQLV